MPSLALLAAVAAHFSTIGDGAVLFGEVPLGGRAVQGVHRGGVVGESDLAGGTGAEVRGAMPAAAPQSWLVSTIATTHGDSFFLMQLGITKIALTDQIG
ncbi:hypothetical protein MCHIJ_35820 [Mycolicibacterium chitae]|uniref:hypothetical protein n=1 Tax=Mycolicibacterium chitae TaxID=1792 RepID=UPI000F82C9E3|nr:hypothetical protein [Mycolicibacterium chitae]MCV7108220.1 hypothetical protein [Mycolicibacterium chitae]BBZ04145.1 hypothetical protein MCHIJ_35820 [Mycolicibacterium chitae]